MIFIKVRFYPRKLRQSYAMADWRRLVKVLVSCLTKLLV
jgi:hypothetical protein